MTSLIFSNGFAKGADLVVAALSDTQPAEIDYSPDEQSWSLRDIAAHLADSEIVAARRFRRLIADPDPVLEAFDEKLWAANLGYNRRHPGDCLKSFLALAYRESRSSQTSGTGCLR